MTYATLNADLVIDACKRALEERASRENAGEHVSSQRNEQIILLMRLASASRMGGAGGVITVEIRQFDLIAANWPFGN